MPFANIHLQPLNPQSDFPHIAELRNLVDPEPVTAEQLQEWEQQIPQGQIRHRVVAVDEEGQMVGFNDTGWDPWMQPGLFDLRVLVHPAWRQQGIGALLYDDALQFSRAHGATKFQGRVRDHADDGLRFARQRGFAIDRHVFESTLDLTTFDERRQSGAVEAAGAAGIRFFTLADVGNTPEAQRRLYDLNARVSMDVPGSESFQSFMPFEVFQAAVCAASWYRPDGEIIAAAGDAWIGLAAVGYFERTQSMYNMITGVDRAYRGQGLAQALKLLSIRCARSYGARYIRTNNDSQNAPMLAINRKFGYKPEPGYYVVVRDLAEKQP